VVTLRRWPYCPNKNVLSERLNCPYDSSGCRNSGGKLFHSRDAAAANVRHWDSKFDVMAEHGQMMIFLTQGVEYITKIFATFPVFQWRLLDITKFGIMIHQGQVLTIHGWLNLPSQKWDAQSPIFPVCDIYVLHPDWQDFYKMQGDCWLAGSWWVVPTPTPIYGECCDAVDYHDMHCNDGFLVLCCAMFWKVML